MRPLNLYEDLGFSSLTNYPYYISSGSQSCTAGYISLIISHTVFILSIVGLVPMLNIAEVKQ